MTDSTHRNSGIITSSEVLAHYVEIALMYEELRAAIDGGHESMTHADALAEISAMRAENAALQQGYDAAVDALKDMAVEFRALDLPYGSKAYAKAIAVIYSHPQVAAHAAVAGPSETVKFVDKSTADPVEKARRYLKAMGDQRMNSAYFFDDGYPRLEISQDALATLAVLEQLSAAPQTDRQPAVQQGAPVAWRSWDSENSRWNFTLWPDEWAGHADVWEPLYTTQAASVAQGDAWRDLCWQIADALECTPCTADEVLPRVLTVAEDAARWRETLMHIGAANHLGGQHFTLNTLRIADQMFLLRGSVAQHFTKCIDAARAQAKKGA